MINPLSLLSSANPLSATVKLYGGIAIALILAAIAAYGFYLYKTVDVLTARLETARTVQAAMQSNINSLQASITTQNASIESYRTAGMQLQARMDATAATLDARRKTHIQAVERWLHAPVPDGCAGSIQWLRDSSKELSTWR